MNLNINNRKEISVARADGIIQDLYSKYYGLKNQAIVSSYSFEERLLTAHEIKNGIKSNGMYFYRRTNEDFALPCAENKNLLIQSQPVNLASNDYLGFAKHAAIKNAAIEAIKNEGASSGSVPMLAGTSELHKTLERELASFLSYEATITYNSCYAANYGLLTSLLTPADVAILDISVHASIIDGCSNTNKIFFSHNDTASLKVALMKASSYKNKMVIVDGVYSMDGDIALLDEIIEITKDEDAWLMVDESHAIGVIGESGKGTHSHFSMDLKADIITGSLGKAMGGAGGFVAGSQELISFLEISSRPFIFSTSIPQHIAAQLTQAIRLVKSDNSIRERLWRNIDYFKSHVDQMGFEPHQSQSAIIPLIIRDEIKLLNFCRFLHDNCVFVNPIFYPVVSRKKSRIRLSVTASLSKEELAYALDRIETAAHKFVINSSI